MLHLLLLLYHTLGKEIGGTGFERGHAHTKKEGMSPQRTVKIETQI